MLGGTEKIDGKCNARLYIYDDFGDNSCTIQCQLNPDHEGEHFEQFHRGEKPVKIYWGVDEDKT